MRENLSLASYVIPPFLTMRLGSIATALYRVLRLSQWVTVKFLGLTAYHSFFRCVVTYSEMQGLPLVHTAKPALRPSSGGRRNRARI